MPPKLYQIILKKFLKKGVPLDEAQQKAARIYVGMGKTERARKIRAALLKRDLKETRRGKKKKKK